MTRENKVRILVSHLHNQASRESMILWLLTKPERIDCRMKSRMRRVGSGRKLTPNYWRGRLPRRASKQTTE